MEKNANGRADDEVSAEGARPQDVSSGAASSLPADGAADPARSYVQSLGEKVPTDDAAVTPGAPGSNYKPTWLERIEESRRLIGVGLVALFVIALGVWYVVAFALPKRAERQRRAAEAPAVLAAQQKLDQEIQAWREQYARATDFADPGLRATLQQLIERQRQQLTHAVVGEQPERFEQLRALEKTRDSIQSREAAARSAIAEAAAEAARQRGDRATELEKLREALQLRQAANASATVPAESNPPLQTKLQAALDDAASATLVQAIESAVAKAKAATAADRPAELLQALQDEKAARTRIIEQFPSSRAADRAALQRVESEIASTEAAVLVARISSLERDAAAATAAGQPTVAAQAFSGAAELQRRVNELYPTSRFASAPRAEEFEIKRETVLAAPLWKEVREIDQAVRGSLQRADTSGLGEKLARGSKLLSDIATQFPRAQQGDDTLRKRILFLWLKRDALAGILATVEAQLVAAPSARGVRLSATEVTQELYERVMNGNPSRNIGPTLPVESVTWDEAREFCRRLSWIIGADVRLPLEQEFTALFGARSDSGWLLETANSRTHAVAQSPKDRSGTHDIAGNVAEWLQRESDAGVTAPVGGGSFLRARNEVERNPISVVAKTQRSRDVGFRFVVAR
jgi:hypothetical protein